MDLRSAPIKGRKDQTISHLFQSNAVVLKEASATPRDLRFQTDQNIGAVFSVKQIDLDPIVAGPHDRRWLRQLLRLFCLSIGAVGLLMAGAACSSEAQSAAAPTAVAAPVVRAVQTTAGAATAVVDTAATATAPPATPTELHVTPTPDLRPPLSRTLNILVLGSDRRPNTPNWRTDVMMIVALDLDAGRAGVISIPRDLYLEAIPNHTANRINTVDYLGEQDQPDGGGPALLKALISQHMDIRIDHFMRFDFESFKAFVDALGGIEITIDCSYRDLVTWGAAGIDLKPGIARLTGDQALKYVRSRYMGGDLDRARRQQRFAWAVRNQILQENLLPRLPAIYQALAASIDSDIGIVTALQLVRFVLSLDEEEVHGLVLAPPTMLTPGWRQGMSVFIPNWSAVRASTTEIFENPPFTSANTPARCP